MSYWHLPSTVAGLLLLAVGAMLLPLWYILLFTATPTGLSAAEAAWGQLQYSFASPERLFFALLAAIPLVCISAALGYLFGAAGKRTGATILLSVACLALIGTLALNEWVFAALLLVAVFYGVRCVRDA